MVRTDATNPMTRAKRFIVSLSESSRDTACAMVVDGIVGWSRDRAGAWKVFLVLSFWIGLRRYLIIYLDCRRELLVFLILSTFYADLPYRRIRLACFSLRLVN